MAGRICVVTGATGGIGGATAAGLARSGARVALVARSAERGAALQARLTREGGDARLFVERIRRGEYSDYHVRIVEGVPTPASNPDKSEGNNLG